MRKISLKKKLFILLSHICLIIFITSCSKDSDNNDDSPAQYTIEGANPIGNEYTIYTVTGVPSGASVKWSVSDARFVLSQNGYNSTYIKANQSGVEAILTAKVLRGDELIGWLTKVIYSSY